MFGRIQNLHISQTVFFFSFRYFLFGRIQNLHISQTFPLPYIYIISLVEFKIYISLKPPIAVVPRTTGLVEFKIYISLKLKHRVF